MDHPPIGIAQASDIAPTKGGRSIPQPPNTVVPQIKCPRVRYIFRLEVGRRLYTYGHLFPSTCDDAPKPSLRIPNTKLWRTPSGKGARPRGSQTPPPPLSALASSYDTAVHRVGKQKQYISVRPLTENALRAPVPAGFSPLVRSTFVYVLVFVRRGYGRIRRDREDTRGQELIKYI